MDKALPKFLEQLAASDEGLAPEKKLELDRTLVSGPSMKLFPATN